MQSVIFIKNFTTLERDVNTQHPDWCWK